MVATIVAMVLIIALIAYGSIFSLQRQIDNAQSQLDAMGPDLARATPFVSKMEFARDFQAHQPNFLKCLRDLTVSLPQGPTYLTSFVLQSNMHGTCLGHSGSEKDVIDLCDKLGATLRFTAIGRKLDARAKGNVTDVSFTINFTYVPGIDAPSKEVKGKQPATKEATGKEAASKDAPSKDAAIKDAADKDAAEKETAVKEVAGK